jgi:acrylyl-CoA reductase (NADPH)
LKEIANGDQTMTFRAMVIDKVDSGHTVAIEALGDDQLPMDGVTVAVEYSTLNFKDALAISGKSSIVRSYPMVPGIDFAGTVTASYNHEWSPGDKVVLNGWGVGESHWGGLAQRARVKGSWLIPLPLTLSTRQAMTIGTAGYSASLSVEKLLRFGIRPDQGEILVTGATGGVRSVAIALLARAGFSVVAATGKTSEGDYLRELGASAIIDRSELGTPGKPMQKERWAAVVDSAGSHTLANVCAQTREGGVVIACGLAQGMDFPGSVAPFILRGITLAGIESVRAPRPIRLAAWNRLARDLDPLTLESIAVEVSLAGAIEAAQDLIEGNVRGRIVVDVNR